MVLTNLRLRVNDLPNNLLPNDVAEIEAALEQKGEVVSDAGFLQLVRFGARHESPGGEKKPIALNDADFAGEKKKSDGIYHGSLAGITRTGVHEIVITAKGATFERIKRHLVQVFQSPLEVQSSLNESTKTYELLIQPYAGLLVPESIEIEASLDGEVVALTNQEQKRWLAAVPAGVQDKIVALSVKAQRSDKRALEVNIEHILPAYEGAQSDGSQPDSADDKVESDEQQHAEEKSEEVPDAEVNDNDGESSWLNVTLYVVLINLLLFGGGFGGFFLWKKLRAKKIAEKEEEISYE